MEVAVPQSLSIAVHDISQVGEARRAAASFAGKLGLDDETAGRLSIVATEAARNICLHGGGGEVIFNSLEYRRQPCLELLAIDRGRGMQDVTKCLRDGYSSTGTPGTGLGAIVRLSDNFDVYSVPEKGTVLVARFMARRGPHQRSIDPVEYSASSIAHPGEVLCGDAWAARSSHSGETFLLADGLGHGQYAELAAREAVRVFREMNGAKPTEIIERAHGVLRSTRGAAVAVARVDCEQNKVIFAGVGNISALIAADGVSRNMVSLNGTVGHQMYKIQEFVYPWSPNALLIMHTDGLGTKWDLQSYLGLAQRSPGAIAGVLYRDFSRLRDDVTVLVARCKTDLPAPGSPAL